MELFKLLGKIAIDNTEAKNAINETTANAQDSEKKQKKSFQGIGSAAKLLGKGIVGVGATIGGAFIGAVEGTREYRTQMGMLVSAYETAGHSSEQAKSTFSELNAVLGDSGQATETAQHIALVAQNEKDLATWTDICTGVYAKFGESLPVEGLAEAANHTAQVGEVQGSLADALEWSGVSVDDFNAKLAACGSEQERQQLITSTLNGLYEESASKYKETNKDILEAEKANARLSDAMARVGAIGEPIMTTLKNSFAKVVEYVLPFIEQFASKIPSAVETTKGKFDVVLPYLQNAWKILWSVLQTIWNTVGKPVFEFVVQQVQKVVSFYQQNFPKIQKVVKDVFTIIKSLWENVLKPVLTILGNFLKNTLLPIWNKAFDGIMKAVKIAFDGVIKLWNNSLKPILNGIISFVSGVLTGNWKKAWNGIKSIVSGVFSGIKTVISTGTKLIQSVFSSGLDVLKTIASKIFGKVKDTISEKIESARDAVDKAIKKIKDFFNIDLKFKGLKMPSIKLTLEKGKGLMQKAAELIGLEGIPKFSVTWNAEGAIFSKPTIIPTVQGWQGVGDGGKEAVAPIDVLMNYIKTAVQEENKELLSLMEMIFKLLSKYLPELSGMKIVLDSGVMVGELTPAIDQELGHISVRKMRK